MATVGTIEPFDEAVGDWTSYVERLDMYFIANKVKQDTKVPAFLSLIGGKTYALLRSLISPEKPSTKTYDELTDILEKHLNPKPLLIAERFRFYKRNQQEGESLSQYIAVLKRLTLHCDFGDVLNDAVRDRFVCGMRTEAIQKRLLTEANLTYERAVQIAVSMETAAKDSHELSNDARNDVHKISASSSSSARNACYRCGSYDHQQWNCRFTNGFVINVRRQDT